MTTLSHASTWLIFFLEPILDVLTKYGLHFICNHGTSCRSCLVVLCIQGLFTCFYLVFIFYRILIFAIVLTKVYASPNLLLTGSGRARSWIHKDRWVPNVRCHFESLLASTHNRLCGGDGKRARGVFSGWVSPWSSGTRRGFLMRRLRSRRIKIIWTHRAHHCTGGILFLSLRAWWPSLSIHSSSIYRLLTIP